ncbi:MAG: dihydroorotase [Planctomycetes bacterium]|nr:dihydroorotase [Planctomycetota bacterium]
MPSLLLRGGRIIDPAHRIDRVADLLCVDGTVKRIGAKISGADEVLDVAGLVVAPGFVDMHVHLREPGKEEEETIASGSAAAIAGGFTSVAAMPNTEPAVDTQAAAEFVIQQGRRAGKANVYPIGAVTKERKGEELAEMGALVRGGAVAFSDDGAPVQNAEMMRIGLQYAKMFDRVVISHCEDRDLCGSGVMNAGVVAMTLGLSGMPRIAEDIMVHRDIALVAATGGRLHIAHLSTAGGVDLVRAAQKRGLRVTAEATPHHVALTDEAVREYDPNFKMNPPLRTATDVAAVRDGLRDGTIAAIATDHAPHAAEEKECEFVAAPFGVIGLETALPVVITELVEKKVLSLVQAVARLTAGPARILGIPKGTLKPGADADITVFDPKSAWVIDPSKFRSKSRNCPFAGWKVRGRVVHTIVSGKRMDP